MPSVKRRSHLLFVRGGTGVVRSPCHMREGIAGSMWMSVLPVPAVASYRLSFAKQGIQNALSCEPHVLTPASSMVLGACKACEVFLSIELTLAQSVK